MWAAYVAALHAGPPRTASGECIAGCGAVPEDSGPERERVTVLREALAAEGIIPEELGFLLG